MEPNKFEKHIKNRLQEREIKPSDDAWSRISDQLNTPKKSRKNDFFWYGIAAGFIGIVIVSVLFFRSQEHTVEIVETEEKISKDKQITLDPISKKSEDYSTQTEEAVVVSSDENIKTIEEPVDLNTNETGIATAVVTEESFTTIDKTVDQDSEKLIDSKIAEVIAQVASLESDNKTVTDAEVDSLLRKAQKEILTEKLFQKEGKVDAMALLTEVEGELDQSFRDQIFNKLKAGFVKVRTAVADRNN